jgi:hypothetical protein
VQRIRARRPRMLFGYPSALSKIAGHAEQQGIAMADLGIRVAFCTSERLYDEQRQMLTQIQAMPGFVNKVRHRFTVPGNHQSLCLEYGGLAPHGMVAAFTVHAAP